jgi:hypothetical protein
MSDTALDLSRAGLMIYSTQIGSARTGRVGIAHHELNRILSWWAVPTLRATRQ